ncbi:hypothetical protein RJ639_017330 [Escallonia herrerae]|uniref:Reverse transcriptase/retrotransposon-derived protein RNase H-like domain-containing protein n=1 Tax=Escallonia herrerae TaxID=1293975 RepID=A0AA89ALL7_9ASTE|nr:hypothetical protein RJ639_017330 [Escallonia herrerae]
MARGVRPGTPLRFSLNKHPPENMSDLLDRVEKYLRAEEDSTMSHQEEIHSGQKRRDRPEGKNQDEPKRPRALSKSFTPLNTTHEHILHQIKGQNIIKWPKPTRGPTERRDSQQSGRRNNPRRADEAPLKEPHVINTISGGPSASGPSSSSRKAYARQVNLAQGPAKRTKASISLEFDDADLDGVSLPHDDALVITLRIDAFQVKRILVYTGSSADIIFEDAFNQMGISDDRVKPISFPLYGFTGAGFIKGDQILARRCYVASCKAEETLFIDDQRDEKALRRTEPVEALVSIPIVLMGRIAALSRFLSKSAERCLPFFKALKNIKNFEWTDECQTSFDKLKEYLTSPPLLSKPIPGEDLFLYLAVAESAVSAVLIREQDGRQFPIYYVSKVLQGAEQRYPNAEKLAFALLIAARKLRPYFQSHTIIWIDPQWARWPDRRIRSPL